MLHKLLCLFGFHKVLLLNPNGEHSPWVTVGRPYYTKCVHCEKESDVFILTGDMLP